MFSNIIIYDISYNNMSKTGWLKDNYQAEEKTLQDYLEFYFDWFSKPT